MNWIADLVERNGRRFAIETVMVMRGCNRAEATIKVLAAERITKEQVEGTAEKLMEVL